MMRGNGIRLMLGGASAALLSCTLLAEAVDPAATVASAVSPDGRNEIRLHAAPLRYEVRRDGVLLVAPTPVNLRIGGRELASPDARTLSVVARASAGTLTTPVYKKASIDLAANGCRADFGNWHLHWWRAMTVSPTALS